MKQKLAIKVVDSKKLRLDPLPQTEGCLVSHYHSCVSILLPDDHQSLHVHYEIEDAFEVSVSVIVILNSCGSI